MKLDDAKKVLKDHYDSLIKEAITVKKALLLLENKLEKMAPPVRKKYKLSATALANIRAGVKKRLAKARAAGGKKKTPTSSVDGNRG